MPTTEGSTFGEELESIKNEVKQSLDQERREKNDAEQVKESESAKADREMRAIHDALANLTGHTAKAVVPPPPDQDNAMDTDPLATVDASVKEEVTDLVAETLNGGSIVAATDKAMKKNDLIVPDLYRDAMAKEIHRQFSDQNIL